MDRTDPRAQAENLGKLDSSLKRHTGLLNKLRASINTVANTAALLKEIQGLSLEKYIDEAVGASIEGVGKCKNASEIHAAIEVFHSFPSSGKRAHHEPQVVSALHQRFPDVYGPKFGQQILTAIPYAPSTLADRDIREKEDSARIAKQRILIRVIGEAELVGVIKGNGDTTLAVLKEMASSTQLIPLTRKQPGLTVRTAHVRQGEPRGRRACRDRIRTLPRRRVLACEGECRYQRPRA